MWLVRTDSYTRTTERRGPASSTESAVRIQQGKVGEVIKGLRKSVTKRGLRGERKTTLLDEANGFWDNRSRMTYSVHLVAGLPIASGAVEGDRKQLLKDHMERSGMRWTEDGGTSGAETMLKLRTAYLSRDFEEY